MIGPFPGDIRLCDPERDKDKPLSEIFDFEVWDGHRWVHARDANKMVYVVEISTK